jgi:hypothetical protein
MVRNALQFLRLHNLRDSLNPFVTAIRRSLPDSRLRQRERFHIVNYGMLP